ncbi:bifunctional diaminohydroxyphosphoribosylaminopyrimidine deaminase/5-amino-6-(5-phosphoribosylamino)uracil reductase RibD [Hahella ganghwensis]|uniref:bifunctional diaminohydroxyphosphoribosylaminopyrimidine deaminase/5-amino-6-(5-phosphoribosylamino)uracil reductase RibD n=1 Tax=Hahella ganghwensis TaxID=286420 RepID=UPI000375BB29|nr:bifunctional diaminohydroxyphosphoribosylaminopyrimidine deaminase/5-amino-6-(5-phosphoribosylamino)uracil reductase RibD [Hahella ganghwensis]
MPFTTFDHEMMALALREAAKGLYTTDPNPRVGCVLVKEGKVIATGYHQRAGEGHAEVNALKAAGADAMGADCYVTLEPCSHQGRTPPCADALIRAGVHRVVAAVKDPNPQVAGSGLARIADAGIETASGLMAVQAEALNAGFFRRMKTGMPLVRLKMAMSLDGRTALANGESQWITGPEAREDVQKLRAMSSAIITGTGTVLADDPSLNVRSEAVKRASSGELRQPLRVVLDRKGRMEPGLRIVSVPGNVVLYTSVSGESTLRQKAFSDHVSIIGFDADTEVEQLRRVLQSLAQAGCNEVLVEAGPQLAGAFISAELVNELWVYQAGKLMGSDARSAFEFGGFENMGQLQQLKLVDCRVVGDDVRLIYQPTGE